MKTTLNIDDGLMRGAKKAAAERGVPLTRVVEDALRAALAPPPPRKAFRLRMVTVRDARLPAVDPADRDALYDLMEDRG
ncbi:MAG: DUF2191 domain-containing protein [Actinomycetota bacterium]